MLLLHESLLAFQKGFSVFRALRGHGRKTITRSSPQANRREGGRSRLMADISIHVLVFRRLYESPKRRSEKQRLGTGTTCASGRGRKPISRAASRKAVASWVCSLSAGRMRGETALFLTSGLIGPADFARFAPTATAPTACSDRLTSLWASSARNSGIPGKYPCSLPETPIYSAIARSCQLSALPWQPHWKRPLRTMENRRTHHCPIATCRHDRHHTLARVAAKAGVSSTMRGGWTIVLQRNIRSSGPFVVAASTDASARLIRTEIGLERGHEARKRKALA